MLHGQFAGRSFRAPMVLVLVFVGFVHNQLLLAQSNSPFSRSHLLQVEAKSLAPCLIDGPWKHESLPEYYWAQNRELQQRLAKFRTCYESSSPDCVQALTLVAGTAGVGKTFITGAVYSKQYPAHAVCKFDIRELYEQWQAEGITRLEPDLRAGEVVLSSLLAVVDRNSSPVFDYLQTHQASFYVVDSLDEIHPHDAAWVLQQIEAFLEQTTDRMVHVAVFGRPGAFREYWRQQADAGTCKCDLAFFFLQPPRFETRGDLTVSSWNYHVWKHHVSWQSAGQSQALPLSAYDRWQAMGFDRAGEFSTVAYDPNENINVAVTSELTEWATKYPVVASTLVNLAGNSIMREIVERRVHAGLAYDERLVMNEYFEQWLLRDTRTAGRPSSELSSFLELYTKLLAAVAITYGEDELIDDDGYFRVGAEDTISVSYNGRKLEFLAYDVLNGSGFECFDPRQADELKVRFEPVWIHRLLIEKGSPATDDPTLKVLSAR